MGAALVFLSSAQAQSRFFAGALGGISALSADGTSTIQPPILNSSAYKPENGPTVDVFVGTHWNDFLSSQLEYLWNENDVTLTALQASPTAFYRENFSTRQNSALASMLLYFRRRSSWARPYLSVGTGVVQLSATPGPPVANGLHPPAAFDSSAVALHVTVGIDLQLKDGWAFRYSFAETTRSNAISQQLSPPANRMLANFRNLFGFVKYF